jgi:hypothetical protein
VNLIDRFGVLRFNGGRSDPVLLVLFGHPAAAMQGAREIESRWGIRSLAWPHRACTFDDVALHILRVLDMLGERELIYGVDRWDEPMEPLHRLLASVDQAPTARERIVARIANMQTTTVLVSGWPRHPIVDLHREAGVAVEEFGPAASIAKMQWPHGTNTVALGPKHPVVHLYRDPSEES